MGMVHRFSCSGGIRGWNKVLRVAWVVLDLLYPITPTIGAHQRGLPATILPDLPTSPVPRLTHYPSTLSISPWGCSMSSRRRGGPLRDEAQQPSKTREPTAPKNDTWPTEGSSVVTMSFSRKVQAAYVRQQRQDIR